VLPFSRRPTVLLAVLLVALAGVLTVPTPALAATPVPAPVVLQLGDSLMWQTCGGAAQLVTSDAPAYLRQHDGGCYGWSGATAADMAFMVGGGRFLSNGPGQPHPYLPGRGLVDPYDLREAIDRADVLVFSLGTNEANRADPVNGCGVRTQTPWPVQIDRPAAAGGDVVPCQLTPAQFAEHIDYFMWLASGRPVFWFDIAVTDPADPAYGQQRQFNDQIWAAAGRYPNLHPVAWARAVAAHPDWLRADGVHLNSPAGNAGRYATLLAALTGCGLR